MDESYRPESKKPETTRSGKAALWATLGSAVLTGVSFVKVDHGEKLWALGALGGLLGIYMSVGAAIASYEKSKKTHTTNESK